MCYLSQGLALHLQAVVVAAAAAATAVLVDIDVYVDADAHRSSHWAAHRAGIFRCSVAMIKCN
jgi:hypothetical protein